MPTLYPLRFKPVLRRYIWGGRRLDSLLGKTLGEGDDYAESWEVVDRGDDQSIVTSGPLAGHSLADLMAEHGGTLLGRHHPLPRFPLLLKFLDCNRTLSVQVHPNDEQAARLDPPDLGKMEAWVVLAAEPRSVIYAGLKPGVDQAALREALARGTCESCLHKIEPMVGDCVFIPPGVVHALGAGLVVAELQQSSDVTFRLFDWNRLDPAGNPRPLHIEQALTVIDYDHGPAQVQSPQPTDQPHVERLIACDKFVWDRWTINRPQIIGGDDRCHVLAVIEGEVTIDGDPSRQPIKKGQVVLLPAEMGPTELRANVPAVMLDGYLPD
ncbi:MAG: class I mannose-6-phosphate isomerase [Planctomycetes bacterium]|nr:class I mannose-6-phosphate isomerase [Planctomycetota bacterium]